MDHRGVPDHLFHFVGLQMANEVPLHVGWQLRCLGGQFLGAVLAEVALPGTVGLH